MKKDGFIDLHTHGIGRYDTLAGRPDHILKMAELHAAAGTAAILPTIYSGPLEQMRRNMEAVRQAMELQKKSEVGAGLPRPDRSQEKISSLVTRHSALILGVHLEGPFLNPSRSGALDKESFLKPALSSLKKLLEGFEEIVKIMTIAPELPGALKIIEKCSAAGIRVNMGHSDATYRQAMDGKRAGAGGVTHIFNAMRPFHHREPGLAGLGLNDEDLYIEVIADGVHLHPGTLELIFNTKRLDRIILVSDSVKSLRRPGNPVYDRSGILAGSGITLSDSVSVLKNLGIPDAEIIEASTDNPARYIKNPQIL